jgi:MshEN domain
MNEKPENATVRTARELDSDKKSKVLSGIRASARPVTIEPLSLDPRLTKWLPAYLARWLIAVPLAEENGNPVIALRQPFGEEALEILRRFPDCVIVTAPEEQILRAIGELYW